MLPYGASDNLYQSLKRFGAVWGMATARAAHHSRTLVSCLPQLAEQGGVYFVGVGCVVVKYNAFIWPLHYMYAVT